MQELATPGEMRSAQTFDFEFKNVEKQYESYHGINVKLRCVLFTLAMRLGRGRGADALDVATLCE